MYSYNITNVLDVYIVSKIRHSIAESGRDLLLEFAQSEPKENFGLT